MAESAMKHFVKQLTPDELKIVHIAINGFGGDDHPMSDDSTVGYFNIVYVAYCLGRYFQANDKDSETRGFITTVLDKLLDYTDGLEATPN